MAGNEKILEAMRFIKSLYPDRDLIPMHEPVFMGNEKVYLNDCIDSTFVSYVGKYVTDFEAMVCKYTGARHAVAVANGTSALMLALISSGVEAGNEVITQSLTFAATAAAIKHSGAEPTFVDIDPDTLGLCPKSLKSFIEKDTEKRGNWLFNRHTGRRVRAVVPVHVFGHPAKLDELQQICLENKLDLIEDAAEAMGSLYKGTHVGLHGKAGVISFNGNKIITNGGGGVIISNDCSLADKARHLSTTAKSPHKWKFAHDDVGYNLRMTNTTAAIGVAQMEKLDVILSNKRMLAKQYLRFFEENSFSGIREPDLCRSNYWLNAVLLDNERERDLFLELTNSSGIQTRPVWEPLHTLKPYADCYAIEMPVCLFYAQRLVNIPSSYCKLFDTKMALES